MLDSHSVLRQDCGTLLSFRRHGQDSLSLEIQIDVTRLVPRFQNMFQHLKKAFETGFNIGVGHDDTEDFIAADPVLVINCAD